jgi:tetratricopeptide (TPR) repeat protein
MFNPAMMESMKHMMNGNMMKQSAEMMSKMSDEELKSFSSMTGMSIDPKFLRSASASMASMDESTLENLKNRAPSTIPPGATMVNPESLSSLPLQPSKSLDLKNQGTEKFKKGEISEAARLYREGIKEVEKSSLSEANKQLEISLRMNLVACLAKEEKFEEIVEQCKKTLVLESNTRALYRYGQALFRLGKLQDALEYLKRAKQQSPDDNASKV